MNPRDKLRRADALVIAEQLPEAIAEYLAVADYYESQGFVVKSVAVLRQVLELTERTETHCSDARTRALLGLLRAYTQLGLAADADEIRALLN
jgi:hypothetical protein